VWECDGTQLTLEVLAEANHKAVCQVRERLQNGNLVPLVPPQEKVIIAGCGHSSGAALCIVQQAHYQSFDLIGNFGAACGEIKGGDQESGADPLFIINNGFVTLDQDACLPLFCLEDVPKDVQQAYKSYSAPSPIGLLFVAHPEKLAQFAENIDIPTLIVFGEHDLVLTPCEEIQFIKVQRTARYTNILEQRITTTLLQQDMICGHTYTTGYRLGLGNNIVEQDHRFIKKITNPMMGLNHSGQRS
jgi:hypothetical protein